MKYLVGCIGTLLIVISPSMMLADDRMANLIGPWEGTGRMAASYDARLQKVRCRANGLEGTEKGDFQIEGFCAFASGNSRFVLRIVSDADNKIRAAVRLQGFDGTAQFTGTIGTNGLELTSREPVIGNEQAFHVRLVVETLDNQHLGIRQWIWPDGSDKARETFFITMLRSIKGS